MWKLNGGKSGCVTLNIKQGSPNNPGLNHQVCVFAPGQNAILDVNFSVNLEYQARFCALVSPLRVQLQSALDRREQLFSPNVWLGEDFLKSFMFLVLFKNIQETKQHFEEASSLSKKQIQVIT